MKKIMVFLLVAGVLTGSFVGCSPAYESGNSADSGVEQPSHIDPTVGSDSGTMGDGGTTAATSGSAPTTGQTEERPTGVGGSTTVGSPSANKTTTTTTVTDKEEPMNPITESAAERFRNQKYGIFVHYVPYLSVDEQGKTYDIQTTADRFDAAGFARDIASIGADYIIFTVWHAGMYPLYPSQVMEQYRPGCCSRRDVIGDLLDEMEKYGIEVWLYTHPYLGYHMSDAHRISTGYGVGNHPTQSDKPNPETFQYDKWNDYVNALYKELVERYAGRVQGLFLDEGMSSAEMDRFIDYPRLRSTIKEADPSVLMMQNFYGTNYSCDFGMKEYGPGWGEFRWEYEGEWPCYEIPVGTVISENWMATKASTESVLRYLPQSMFRYTVLEAACNTEGGGTCWAAGPYVGGGWEPGVLSALQEVGERYTAVRTALTDTRPSTSYPVVSGTTINRLSYGIAATQSRVGKTEYIHVLTPPSGKTLSLPLPADGKVFEKAYLLVSNKPLSLKQTATGVTITLPDGVTWDELDTVLVLKVGQQNKPSHPQRYVRDTDVAIVYEGDWEYSRWERNHGDYEGDMHESKDLTAKVSYTFRGTGIAWLTSCSSVQGLVKVWVDDVYQGTFSAFATSYKAQQTPFVISGLSNGVHTIRIENVNERICVDGFIVTE